ncbi:putative NOT transcription complex subunit VIP2 isoform X2 [Wolffia australiana]
MQTSSAQSTLNGLTQNLQDATGRSFSSSFSSQSANATGYHHSGAMLGLHNMQGGINVPNMPGSLGSRNSAMGLAVSSGIQQQGGSIAGGRFASNNIPASISQISHGGSYGHSGVSNRGVGFAGNPAFSSSVNGIGGSMPGINPSSTGISNRMPVPGLGISPILGNAGPRITNSMGNLTGGNIGRSITSGGLSVPGLATRVNLAGNSGPGSLSVQGTNRLKSGVLQQAPQMMGMLGNSYPSSAGTLSQNQMQAGTNPLSSMGMLNDVNPSEMSPFDINDFPQLSGRPSSAGGSQGQSVSLRKQGLGVNSIVQPNQEFSIHNEDFPALPGFKGGNNEFSMDLHQKDQIHDNMSMMQSQHLNATPGFHVGRSAGFNIGGSYPSHHQQQQQHSPFNVVDFSSSISQDVHLHGSDMFSSHGSFHGQAQTGGGPPSLGLRPLNPPSPSSSIGVYNQLLQQYPSPNPSQFRLQQMPALGQYRDQTLKAMTGTQGASAISAAAPDRFGLLGLLSVIKLNDQDLSSLALGIDLTTLGLNLNSSDTLYKTFGSPWLEEPAKGDPEFAVPTCYYAKPPPELHGFFAKFKLETLFYIFYSMPKDDAQLYAAYELGSRGWFYHKEHRLWFIRVANVEPLVKTNTYERGSYHCFDPNTWDTVRKDNFVVHYDMVEKKPAISISRP